jgi:hypothetical protein
MMRLCALAFAFAFDGVSKLIRKIETALADSEGIPASIERQAKIDPPKGARPTNTLCENSVHFHYQN